MNGVQFLTALWGVEPPKNTFIQLWDMRAKRSIYMPAVYRAQSDGQPDWFTGMALAGRRFPAHRRAAANQTVAIAGMWLDIDVKGGACPNRTAALGLANAKLSPTITVDSGNGVHAYWLFEHGPWMFRKTDDRDQAALMVQQWQALHRAHATNKGWTLDSTHDLARIMRMPGSINAKDPDNPRPVTVIEAAGPRHSRDTIAALCAQAPVDMAPTISRNDVGRPVVLTGDASMFAAKLDAIQHNSPEFWLSWNHHGHPDWTLSEWDLSLCSLAADAMTDPELVALIEAHRARWGETTKAHRAGYLQRTITRARARADRTDAARRLGDLARRAA